MLHCPKRLDHREVLPLLLPIACPPFPQAKVQIIQNTSSKHRMYRHINLHPRYIEFSLYCTYVNPIYHTTGKHQDRKPNQTPFKPPYTSRTTQLSAVSAGTKGLLSVAGAKATSDEESETCWWEG